MLDLLMNRIDKIFVIYKECQEQGNQWGINYWGNILNQLMRQAEKPIPHPK